MTGAASPTGLELHDLSAGYHGHPVVRNLNMKVQPGEVVALLGPNGAGKSTSLLAIAGEIDSLGGSVTLDGAALKGPLHSRARRGLGFIISERSVFPDLSTEENLRVGRCDVDKALSLFPELRPLLRRRGGLLSGGEQQILTLARILAREPRYLLADELSLGLAPLVVDRIFAALRTAVNNDIGVFIIEQNVRKALNIADRVYVMVRGEIVLEGTADEIGGSVEDVYLSGARTATPAADATVDRRTQQD